ncbi:hypothetical protein SprV_0802645300 [Sparganum proliferum]
MINAHPVVFIETPRNELAHRLVGLPVADADTSVQNRWRQFRETVQLAALNALGRGRRQHQDRTRTDTTNVHLYNRKWNRQPSDSHRGISLFNITGKIFARVLLNRLNDHLERELLSESQRGSRRHSGTIAMIFAARQLQDADPPILYLCESDESLGQANIPDRNRSYWTSSGHVQHPDDTNLCLLVHLCPAFVSVTQPEGALDPPSPSSTTISATAPAARAPVPSTNTHNNDALSNINLSTANTSDADSVSTCSHCNPTLD